MFAVLGTSDYYRLQRALAQPGVIELAGRSQGIGMAPDFYYYYEALVYTADKVPTDPGPNHLVDLGFGVGPEPRRLQVEVVGLEGALRFRQAPRVRGRWVPGEVLPPGVASKDLPGYRENAAGESIVAASPELLRRLAVVPREVA